LEIVIWKVPKPVTPTDAAVETRRAS